MFVATLAILTSQFPYAQSVTSTVAVLDGKPYKIERWSSMLPKMLENGRRPSIPNSWSALRTPYIPNSYRAGDVERFPLPGAHESLPLTAIDPPRILLERTLRVDALMKKLLNSGRGSKAQR